MAEPLVRVSHSGSVRTLALNRPQALNSFTGEMHGELRAALDAAAADREVRCVVVTGTGRGFCAGQDLADPAVAPSSEIGAPQTDVGSAIERFYKPLALRIRSMPVPVVAAVNGVAAGAGRELRAAAATSSSPRARRASSRRSPRSAWFPIAAAPGSCRAWSAAPTRWRWRCSATSSAPKTRCASGLIWKCVDDAVLQRRGRSARRPPRRDADACAGGDAPGARRVAAARSGRRARPRGRCAANARRRARLPRRRGRVHGQARPGLRRSLAGT